MDRNTIRWRKSPIHHLSNLFFLAYLALFPGSTITVALDKVPSWGYQMGNLLLLLQGAAVLCWLLTHYGRRGAVLASVLLGSAWLIEYLGVTTGLPFGRYYYTKQLQPQLLGVPLPIVCAWLAIVTGAWQAAFCDANKPLRQRPRHTFGSFMLPVAFSALLVLLLDLQIEPVATSINHYWVWMDSGPYYHVPTANFAAWYFFGACMTALTALTLTPSSGATEAISAFQDSRAPLARSLHPIHHIPVYLLLLNILMFTTINLTRGYPLAGFVGAGTLIIGIVAHVRARAA